MAVYIRTIVIVVIVTLLDTFLPHTKWSMPKDTLEVFFGVFGVVYAIIVGFVLYEALTNYSDIRHHMRNEINDLQDLRDFLMYVEGHQEEKKEIRAGLVTYARSVAGKQWDEMRKRRMSAEVDMDTPPELYAIMEKIQRIKPGNEEDRRAVDRLIRTVAQITTHRTNRITASIERLPSLLVQLFAILSLMMMATFTLMPVDDPTLRIVLMVATSFAVAFTYFVILDIDYPFRGVWAITPEPFEQFVEKTEERSA